MTEMRKITVNLPAHLLDATLSGSGRGLTEVIREALEEYNHRQACRRLLQLRGKVKFALSYEQLAGKDDD